MNPSSTLFSKNKLLEFSEQHPYILLATICALIVLVIIMFCGSHGLTISNLTKKIRKRKGVKGVGEEEELDELIESIHSKQKK